MRPAKEKEGLREEQRGRCGPRREWLQRGEEKQPGCSEKGLLFSEEVISAKIPARMKLTITAKTLMTDEKSASRHSTPWDDAQSSSPRRDDTKNDGVWNQLQDL